MGGPFAILAAGAAEPLALGAVTVGVAVIGFFAGAWSGRRRRNYNRKALRGMPKARTGANQQALLQSSAEDKHLNLLLEYGPAPIIIVGEAAHTPSPAAFNKPRAEAMLNLSKKAYSRPEDDAGFRTRNIRGLPTITVFDKKLLKSLFKGVLRVHVRSASNLRAADLDGQANPFVEVFVAASSFRTAAAGKTLNPQWDEVHWLYIKDPAYDALCIRVVDEDLMSDGDDLGVAVLGLGGLVLNAPEELNFKLPLRGFAGENSTVTLSCRYLPFTEEAGPETIPELKSIPADEAALKAPTITLEEMGDGHLKPVAYVDCGKTDTQAWLLADPEQRQLALAFRGTSALMDGITDARFMPCGFQTIIESQRKEVNVHRGFMRAYKSVRRLLSIMVQRITDADPKDPSLWTVLITGHSLGAALATLAAYELGLYRRYAGKIKSISLYTYGSPRVGNRAFVEEFDRLVPDTWRFTNPLDLVTSVPPSGFIFKYRHVGHPVRLSPKGRMRRGLNSTEEKENPGAAKKDVQKDVNCFVALLSFRGIKEHSGDLYTSRLADARED